MDSASQSHPTISMEAGAAANGNSNEQREFPLARQSSIYSLTLDEFQNAICEPGKNFGSMNMDEFLTNIWNAEENQAIAAAMQEGSHSDHPNGSVIAGDKTLITQSSLPRQGSLTIPAPLCRKTVEEVWSEIHRNQQQQEHPNGGNPVSAPRQPTFGEMTLEDFLIKAGIVRESCGTSVGASSSHFPPQQQQQQQTFGYFRNSSVAEPQQSFPNVMGGSFGYPDPRNTANGAMVGGNPPYQSYPPPQQQQQQQQQQFGGRIGSGSVPVPGGGYGGPQPVSPVSSDGMGQRQMMDNSVSQYGMEMIRVGSGRKRVDDGIPEKGVERRQRRMIKNRESAARSRARKQAYTVELEAELEMLKEENTRLRNEREEEEQKRRKKLLEAMMTIAKAAPANERKYKMLRRTFTGPW